MVLNTNIGESIHSLENSPNNSNNKKVRNLQSPIGRSFINKSLMQKNSKSLNKNFYSNFNNSKLGSGKKGLQNSFSFLSNINHNNLSYSMNTGRKKIPKILNRKNLELDLNNSNNLLSSVTNTQGNLATENINNLVSIDRYVTVKTETMGKYRTEIIKQQEDKDDDKLNGGLFGNQSVLESSKNSMDGNKNPYENSLIQVHIKDKNYGNPDESRDVIGTNKFIYDNLCGSLFDIQRIFYDKTVKDIEHYNKWKLKMQKIRVSTLVPKTTVENINPKAKENSIISEEANEDVEKEGEGGEEDDYLEKKKEKEKQKQKKLKQNREKEESKVKNRLMKSDDHELYAEYKYSSKIFPEGREQFSFKYNLVDVVLFGGLVMNKNNNNLWTLDPG